MEKNENMKDNIQEADSEALFIPFLLRRNKSLMMISSFCSARRDWGNVFVDVIWGSKLQDNFRLVYIYNINDDNNF